MKKRVKSFKLKLPKGWKVKSFKLKLPKGWRTK